jgi:hypothetical protein
LNFKNFISTVTSILLLSVSAVAYCDNEPSYEDTVSLITKTMASNTSDVRKESYGYIRFTKCIMEYNVAGTYPVGDLYNIKFSNINFASLNYQGSRAGHDYTAFVILNFKEPFQSKGDFKDITIHTAVINVSDNDAAQVLLKAFLHLGELCGAPGMAVGGSGSSPVLAPDK